MNYKIHGKTIFIQVNGLINQFTINGNEVYKVIDHYSGDQLRQYFHTIGETPVNTEAQLINELRLKDKI